MKATLDVIDQISVWSGKTARWLCLLIVLVIVYEVAARYIFDAPTIWAHSTSEMINVAIASLGWAYTHQVKAHVRIDAIYSHLSYRKQAFVDSAAFILLFIPIIGALWWAAIVRVLFSISVNEKIMGTNWFPTTIPIRVVLFIGLTLFLLQGLAQFIRDLHFLLKGKQL